LATPAHGGGYEFRTIWHLLQYRIGQSGRRPAVQRQVADRCRRFLPAWQLPPGSRRTESVRRVPRSQLDRQLVPRDRDIPATLTVRNEWADGICAHRVDVLDSRCAVRLVETFPWRIES